MRAIPEELKLKMSADVYYEKCCLLDNNCLGRIEWHHNLIFGGKQVNEEFCILPICHWHHEREKLPEFKEKLNWIMWSRAVYLEVDKFSKAVNYHYEKEKLIKKNGIYSIKR